MSYEGYEEFLCQNGHYWTVDAMTMIHGDNEEKDKARICAVCHHKAVYVASVDETNGVDVDIPETMPAPKKLIGHTDIPLTDHYGNKYFGKANRYKPVFDNPRQMYKRINAETETLGYQAFLRAWDTSNQNNNLWHLVAMEFEAFLKQKGDKINFLMMEEFFRGLRYGSVVKIINPICSSGQICKLTVKVVNPFLFTDQVMAFFSKDQYAPDLGATIVGLEK